MRLLNLPVVVLLHTCTSNKSWQNQIQNSLLQALITIKTLTLCVLKQYAAQYKWHYAKNLSNFDVAAA